MISLRSAVVSVSFIASVACAQPFSGETIAVVMDAAHDGNALATASAGSGVDIIDYDPVRRHLYLPGARSATITIFDVGANGPLTPLATSSTATGAHCVTTDGKDAYVCDPNRGRLLVVHDSYPAAK